MATIDKINDDLKNAMINKDSELLSALRLLKSALKNAEISKRSPLDENEVLSQIEKQAKQRRDSIDQYEKGGRPELAAKEKLELEIIERYLPQKLSEEEIINLVDKAILDLDAKGISDMGKVIKEVMSRSAGRASGGDVSRIVRERLS